MNAERRVFSLGQRVKTFIEVGSKGKAFGKENEPKDELQIPMTDFAHHFDLRYAPMEPQSSIQFMTKFALDIGKRLQGQIGYEGNQFHASMVGDEGLALPLGIEHTIGKSPLGKIEMNLALTTTDSEYSILAGEWYKHKEHGVMRGLRRDEINKLMEEVFKNLLLTKVVSIKKFSS